jgi:hypothetical protein
MRSELFLASYKQNIKESTIFLIMKQQINASFSSCISNVIPLIRFQRLKSLSSKINVSSRIGRDGAVKKKVLSSTFLIIYVRI